MTATTVNKSFVALPWYGATILVIEFTADPSSTTLDLTTLDGGQGLKYVDALLAFSNTGALALQATATYTVSSNGTTVTFGSGASAITALVVIGR